MGLMMYVDVKCMTKIPQRIREGKWNCMTLRFLYFM